MNTNGLVRFAPLDGLDEPRPQPHDEQVATHPRLVGQARRAMWQAQNWLLDRQHTSGRWQSDTESAAPLESHYLLWLAFRGQGESPLAQKMARRLVDRQLPDGGWPESTGEFDISASVRTYLALALAGQAPSSEPLCRARRAILAAGGAAPCDFTTRLYLAVAGQIPFEVCGTSSQSTSTTATALSIVARERKVYEAGRRHSVRELFLTGFCSRSRQTSGSLLPDANSGEFGYFARIAHRIGSLFRRGRDSQSVEQRLLERLPDVGADNCVPALVATLMAFDSRQAERVSNPSTGTDGLKTHPTAWTTCIERLESLVVEDDDAAHIQPRLTPAADSALALRALLESGTSAEQPAVQEGLAWLRSQSSSRTEIAGTALALQAFLTPPAEEAEPSWPEFRLFDDQAPDHTSTSEEAALADCLNSLASLERQCAAAVAELVSPPTRRRVGGLPYKHEAQASESDRSQGSRHAPRDESPHRSPYAGREGYYDRSPICLANLLEALGRLGRRVGEPTVDRAVNALCRQQQTDGSWSRGESGGYLEATAAVLTALTSVGISCEHSAVAAGAHWLLSWQQPCGGWGESPDSVQQPCLRGQGPATASQTAKAILALTAAGHARQAALFHAIRWLLGEQNEEGAWTDESFTLDENSNVPQRNALAATAWPLRALAVWSQAMRTEFERT